MLGQVQHLALDAHIRDICKDLVGVAHLIVEVQRRRDQPAVMGADQHRPDTAEQDQCLGGAVVGGHQVIGLVEIQVVDVVAADEIGHGQGLVAVGHRRRDLVGIQHDIFTRRDLVSLDLILAVHRLACVAVHENAAQAVSGLAVQRVKGDPIRGRGRGVKRHRAADLSDLEETFPVRPGCHGPIPSGDWIRNGWLHPRVPAAVIPGPCYGR